MRIKFSDDGKGVVYPDDGTEDGAVEFLIDGNGVEALSPFVKELALRQLWLRAGQLVARLEKDAVSDERTRAEKVVNFMRVMWNQQTLSAAGLVPPTPRVRAFVDHKFVYALVASGLCAGGHEQALATYKKNVTKQGFKSEEEVSGRIAELCAKYPQLAAAYGADDSSSEKVEAQEL